MRRLPRTILICALLLASTSASTRNLEELERLLARTAPASTPFIEYRFSHLLKRPLRVSGTLEYRADGVLVRTVDAPYHESTEVDGDEVRITRAGHPTRTLPLQRAPQLRMLLASFRALIEGRLTPLQQDFELTLADEADRWSVTLKPHDPTLARHLARIEMRGSGNRPDCLEALEPDGDGSLTFLHAAGADAGTTPPRAEIERRCRAPDVDSSNPTR
jgi:hypothetical protein